MVNYMEFQDWMFDKRVLKRNIRKGIVTREDYHEYLDSLEDLVDNVADPDEDEELEGEKAAEDAEEEAAAEEAPEASEASEAPEQEE